MKLEYFVQLVEAEYGLIKMKLREFHEVKLPSPEEMEQREYEAESLEPPPPGFSVSPIPKTDSEKVVAEQIEALKRQAPELYRSLTESYAPRSMGRMVGPTIRPLVELTIFLTPEQYAELGSPGVHAKLKMTLEKEVD